MGENKQMSTNEYLTQSEIEHNTYLRVKYEYAEYEKHRKIYNRGGIILIFAAAIVFLTLMFTLEQQLFFLTLWIVVTLCTIAFLIRNEYTYYHYRELLGLPDDGVPEGFYDDCEDDEEVDEE